MKYNVKESNTYSGTSLQGYMTASYDDLVVAFGPPTYDETSADGKVDYEWNLVIEDTVDFPNENRNVTIYNWKDYDGGQNALFNPEYEWHIGGHSPLDELFVKEAFAERIASSPLYTQEEANV